MVFSNHACMSHVVGLSVIRCERATDVFIYSKVNPPPQADQVLWYSLFPEAWEQRCPHISPWTSGGTRWLRWSCSAPCWLRFGGGLGVFLADVGGSGSSGCWGGIFWWWGGCQFALLRNRCFQRESQVITLRWLVSFWTGALWTIHNIQVSTDT